MSYFRRPKSQNERRADHGMVCDPDNAGAKARLRTVRGDEIPPDSWSDITPASRADRARGKPSHSPARKAKDKARSDWFE